MVKLDKYDVERAVSKGIKKGLKTDSDETGGIRGWIELLFIFLSVPAILITSLTMKSWIVFFGMVLIVVVGVIVNHYILAVAIPSMWEYALYLRTVEDFHDGKYDMSYSSFLFEFFQSTGVMFLGCVAVYLLAVKFVFR